MTEIRKSDAQLDAEAAAPIDYAALERRIRLHRAMYAAELPLKMTQHRVPSDLEDIPLRGVLEPVLDAGELGGPSMSADMVRRLTEPPSRTVYWARARWALRHTRCRRSHPEHWEPVAWRGSLCDRLVQLTVIGERSFASACIRTGTDPDRTVKVLDRALGFIEDHMAMARKRDAAIAASDVGGVADDRGKITYQMVETVRHAHHAVPGLHMQECPQCRRSAA